MDGQRLQVAGYDLLERLEVRDGVETWAATGRATGRPVLLRLLPADGPDGAARLARDAARLVHLAHPHLLPVRAVLAVDRGVVLACDRPAGRRLAAVVAESGGLTPGEVSALVVPLADALAAVHDVGRVHGRLGTADVLLPDDGRPLLDGVGVAGLLGVVAVPADDVRALATVCRGVLARQYDGTPLAVVLDEAADPASATTARTLQRAVQVAAAARSLGAGQRGTSAPSPRPADDPLRWSPGQLPRRAAATAPASSRPVVRSRGSDEAVLPPVEPHRRRRGRRRRPPARPPWRQWAAGLLAAAAAVMAALTGLAWAGVDGGAPPSALPASRASAAPASSAPRPVSSPTAARAVASWSSVLAGLDRQRATAFATGDRARLVAVYARGSPVGVRDLRQLGRARSAGLAMRGLHLRTRSVRVVHASGDRAVLDVVDVLAPYDVVSSAGAVVEHRSGRGERRWLVSLVQRGGRWRIASTEPIRE